MNATDDTFAELTRLRRRVDELETKLVSVRRDAYLRSIFDDMFEGVQIIDFDFRYVYLNKTAASHGRYAREEMIGRTMGELYAGIEQTEVFRVLRRCMRERVPQQLINSFVYPDGRSAWFDLRINPVPMGILVLSVDISDQKATEEKLRQSRESLATTLECMAEGVITTDTEERVTRMNPAAEALTGWTEAEAKGRALDELVRFLNHKTQEPIDHPVDRVLKDGIKIGLANDTMLVTRSGAQVPIASSGAPLRDAGGALSGVVLVLKDMKEEYQLAAMFQQAQKMEAIGRLAGGVAHDFNNLLTVISGYCDLALTRVASDQTMRAYLEEISAAGESAASMTGQLLAFSRKKVLQPAVIDLNTVVGQMDGILRRLIGEDVDLVTKLRPNLHPVEFDPGQIEQIIMNLAVNARDAMPRGGKLTLETANVELDGEHARSDPDVRPGPHVMIAVTDTGTGMDAETRARIFEPFFTTKEEGKGTGLGLATVYGIVKQSGGNIWVYSEPGRGSTFKVYLPRANGAVAPIRPESKKAAPPRGTETILVVEDEDGVRDLIREVLEMGGYRVLAARDGNEALRLLEGHEGEIHLLLTDVIMPGMGGRQLAEKLAGVHPEMRVVYMSGYTDSAIIHHGVLDPGTAFIEKPVTPDVLLEKIRGFLS